MNICEPVRVFRAGQPGAETPALAENMAFPLPDVPSVTVVPFRTLEAHPMATAPSLGLAEGITDEFSRRSDVLVICTESSVKASADSNASNAVAERLGDQCVVSGSVRVQGKSLRVEAALVDALTGHPRGAVPSEVPGSAVQAGARDLRASLGAVEVSARRALESGSDPPLAVALLGAVNLSKGNHCEALALAEKAVALGPSDADALAMRATSQNSVGLPGEATLSLDAALRRNPFFPSGYLAVRAEALRLGGRVDEATDVSKEEIERDRRAFSRLRLAVYYTQVGERNVAGAQVDSARHANGWFIGASSMIRTRAGTG